MGRGVLDRLLRAMAITTVAVPGCADRSLTVSDGDEGTAEGSSSSGGDGADGAVSTWTSGSPATGGGEADAEADVDDGEIRYDVGMMFDVFMPPPPIDPSECVDVVGNPAFPCDARGSSEPMHYFCVEAEPGVECDPHGGHAAALASECVGGCAVDTGYWATGCGPDPTVTDACCYWLWYVQAGFCIPEGRPFVVDGEVRLAKACTRDDWADACTPDVEGLTREARAGLAEMWTEHARNEHASIAAFARFVLQLLSLGAPADLVQDAQRALADEVRHATASFGLASAYAGRAIGPAALDVDGGLPMGADLEAVVVTTVHEGCVAETISAVLALEAAREASDPAVVAMLTRIAEDEVRHAELAWRFVRWGLARGGPGLRHTVRETFARAALAVPEPLSPPEGLNEDTMTRHGIVGPARHRNLVRIALREIVAPAAGALLRDHADRRTPSPATSPALAALPSSTPTTGRTSMS